MFSMISIVMKVLLSVCWTIIITVGKLTYLYVAPPKWSMIGSLCLCLSGITGVGCHFFVSKMYTKWNSAMPQLRFTYWCDWRLKFLSLNLSWSKLNVTVLTSIHIDIDHLLPEIIPAMLCTMSAIYVNYFVYSIRWITPEALLQKLCAVCLVVLSTLLWIACLSVFLIRALAVHAHITASFWLVTSSVKWLAKGSCHSSPSQWWLSTNNRRWKSSPWIQNFICQVWHIIDYGVVNFWLR